MISPDLKSTSLHQKMNSVIFWMKVREPEVVTMHNTLCCCATNKVNLFLGKLTFELWASETSAQLPIVKSEKRRRQCRQSRIIEYTYTTNDCLTSDQVKCVYPGRYWQKSMYVYLRHINSHTYSTLTRKLTNHNTIPSDGNSAVSVSWGDQVEL